MPIIDGCPFKHPGECPACQEQVRLHSKALMEMLDDERRLNRELQESVVAAVRAILEVRSGKDAVGVLEEERDRLRQDLAQAQAKLLCATEIAAFNGANLDQARQEIASLHAAFSELFERGWDEEGSALLKVTAKRAGEILEALGVEVPSCA